MYLLHKVQVLFGWNCIPAILRSLIFYSSTLLPPSIILPIFCLLANFLPGKADSWQNQRRIQQGQINYVHAVHLSYLSEGMSRLWKITR